MYWIKEQFEQNRLFRRLIIAVQFPLLIYVTHLTQQYILYATQLGVAGHDIVLVGGALQAPFIALLGYSFKVYSQSRSQDATNQSS